MQPPSPDQLRAIARHLRERAADLSYARDDAARRGDHAWVLRCTWQRDDVLALAAEIERWRPVVTRPLRAVISAVVDALAS